MRPFPFTHQLDAMDCGPSCLKMIAKYYGKSFSLDYLRQQSYLSREGVSLLGISEAAEHIGFRSMGVKISYEKLCSEVPLPCIVHWRQKHFVVVYQIKAKKKKISIADPAHGLVSYSESDFLQAWLSSRSAEGEEEGIALLLEPTPDFYAGDGDEMLNKNKLSFLFQYLRPYRRFLIQLMLGMLLGTLLQLIFPFLTQSIVDFGISNQNLSFVSLILIAQLTLFTAQTAVEFIRSWILLHISTRINISIISDFLMKLMKLPIRFFDTKMMGDIMQRIGDHQRIEHFLTSATLNTLFSMVNLVVFTIILGFYNSTLLFIFLASSSLYVAWVTIFLRRRRDLDFKRFAQASQEQSNLIQMISGMQEIKLNNSEQQRRWEWEGIQARLFRISIKGLALSQYQQSGAFFINESKNIVISFFAAQSVISGNMTLGMMMAVQYIIGQLNSPISQLIGFIQSAQDAKISLERLGEIHNQSDEEQIDEHRIIDIPLGQDLHVEHLHFHYDPLSEAVLSDISLRIPHGKTTAIVGMSGSGKTTLIKLLLGFYPAQKGCVRLGQQKLSQYSSKAWRNECGTVMQDGFIFSESLAKNIALGSERIDIQRLQYASQMANLQDMIEALPLGYNTKIGQEGNGISQGQKQRILIARAIYKNPKYFFFDEATNALDANNEKVIMENLQQVFSGRTVVVVAHRLSTVRNADKIVVLEKGEIVEEGSHHDLVAKKGKYFELVRNQLELNA